MALGVAALAVVVLLLVQDAAPQMFPAGSHEVLSALSLASIAAAYLIFQWARRSGAMEWLKAILLAAAFIFWAANQFWPNSPQAGLFNDIAIGLFVLDVFLAMTGWPAVKGSSFGECRVNSASHCGKGCSCE